MSQSMGPESGVAVVWMLRMIDLVIVKVSLRNSFRLSEDGEMDWSREESPDYYIGLSASGIRWTKQRIG